MEDTPAMRLFDAHNHLHDERFAGHQSALMEACRAAGVIRMVVNGSTESDWPAVAELARQYPDCVIPAFGLHPWYVHERTPEWKANLNRFLDEVPGAVVGEIGMDRWILDCPPSARAGIAPEWASHQAAPLDEQAEVFREQMRMAEERNVPASIHCLQAWGPLTEVLRKEPRPACGFLLHSYGGPAELVKPMARLGARFSFPGYFLHERKARHRETFRAIPEERLLVETDAPDQRLPANEELAKVTGVREVGAVWELSGEGGRPLNHPANLVRVYEGLARVLGVEVEVLARGVERNFVGLFGRV